MQNKNRSNKYTFGVCRDCLNQASGLTLTSQDCLYGWKQDFCPTCNDFRHIVVDLRFRGRLKVLFHRKKMK